jgi:undecaprenyl-phosphate galactose phosphotransferase
MKNSIFNPINIVYIGLLVLADFLVLVLSLKFTIFLVESSFLVVFDEFIIKSISEYIWIILIVVLLLYSEKIYTTRFDFWSDTKKILKSLFYGFITVFTIITLSKISVDFSMKFLVVFFLISAFLLPIFRRVLKNIIWF